jgi:PAS domain-containing protein
MMRNPSVGEGASMDASWATEGPSFATLAGWATAVTAATAAIFAVARLIRSCRRALIRLKLIVAGLLGVAELQAKVDRLIEESRPNGGSTMRDSLDRIENLLLLTATNAEYLIADAGIGWWRSDSAGMWTHASRELTLMLRRTPSELLGNGWKNAVPPTNGRMIEAWEDAVEDSRDWRDTHAVLVDAEGGQIPVSIYAKALFNRDRQFVGHQAFVRRAA